MNKAPYQIVCVSDTHGLHRKLNPPDGDIFIHAGDFMRSGQSLDEITDFDAWLGTLPHRHKIVIAGNHDLLFESSPREARALLTHAVYLENDGIALDGLHFWGSPITPKFADWAFAAERGAAIRKYWDRIPKETDVLITHGPPFGILDKANILGAHLGCQELTKAVARITPQLHVFGHVHGGHGQEAGWSDIRFVNCAVLNEAYVLTHEPTVIELSR